MTAKQPEEEPRLAAPSYARDDLDQPVSHAIRQLFEIGIPPDLHTPSKDNDYEFLCYNTYFRNHYTPVHGQEPGRDTEGQSPHLL